MDDVTSEAAAVTDIFSGVDLIRLPRPLHFTW